MGAGGRPVRAARASGRAGPDPAAPDGRGDAVRRPDRLPVAGAPPRGGKGGRYGPTFHEAGGRGGRTTGTKRTLLVLGRLPRLAGGCLTGANPRPVPGSGPWA